MEKGGAELNKQPRHGEPPHPDLEHGPLEERNCQDILCCLLFIGGVVGMVMVASYGFKTGNPQRLTYPYDPDDQACGYDSKVKDYPYVFLVTPEPRFLNRSVCVKSCPNSSNTTVLDCSPNSAVPSCRSNADISQLNYSKNGPGFNQWLNQSVFIYDTESVFGRLCLPTIEPYASEILKVLDLSFIQQSISDIEQTWKIILGSIAFAYLVGFIYMILMRYFSGLITWISILLYFVFLIVVSFLCYKEYLHTKDNSSVYSYNDISVKNSDLLFYSAIVLWVILGISLLVFCCYFSSIKIAIAIIKSAALYMRDVPSAIIIPLVFGVLEIAFWTFWIFMFLYVYSSGDIKQQDHFPFASVTWNKNVRYMLIFQIFEGFWCNAMLHALSEFIQASAVAIWYFSQNGGHSVFSPVLTSVKRALIYHLGSLAFGSFVLAVVQFIRAWLEYMHKQMKEAGAADTQPMKTVIACLRCYGECFERFIQFLNKNAYIQIAIGGKGFCGAAKDAFWLICTNAGRFSIIGGIGHIFISIGKNFIAILTTLTAYFVVTNKSIIFASNLYTPLLPVILIYFISSMIGHVFMTVYGMATDTILQCFCLDEELQKSKGLEAKHCPGPLREILDQHAK